MVILLPPVPGPPGSGTLAMPFHDPHALSTAATMTSARARPAIRLQLRILIHLTQRVAAGPRAAVLPERRALDRAQRRGPAGAAGAPSTRPAWAASSPS